MSHDAPTGPFYHGTKANLVAGDLLAPGYVSNYGSRRNAGWIYFSATLEAATWGAELAQGDAPERIYVVEPTGAFQDDPNLTNKRFPGNPTRSYRSRDPLRITGEVTGWTGHSEDQLKAMKDHIAELARRGVEHEDD